MSGIKAHKLHFGKLPAGIFLKLVKNMVFRRRPILLFRLLDIAPDQFGLWHKGSLDQQHSRFEPVLENISLFAHAQAFQKVPIKIPEDFDTAVVSDNDCNLNKPSKRQ